MMISFGGSVSLLGLVLLCIAGTKSEEAKSKVLICPQPSDPDHFTDVCGPSWDRSCCPGADVHVANGSERSAKEVVGNIEPQKQEAEIETLPEPQQSKSNKKKSVIKKAGKNVLKIVGIVIGVLVLLVVVAIICCCCLPGCFLAKKWSERGSGDGPA